MLVGGGGGGWLRASVEPKKTTLHSGSADESSWAGSDTAPASWTRPSAIRAQFVSTNADLWTHSWLSVGDGRS